VVPDASRISVGSGFVAVSNAWQIEIGFGPCHDAARQSQSVWDHNAERCILRSSQSGRCPAGRAAAPAGRLHIDPYEADYMGSANRTRGYCCDPKTSGQLGALPATNPAKVECLVKRKINVVRRKPLLFGELRRLGSGS